MHGVIAVIERAGRWLMIQRADGVPKPRAWCFPGGGIEPGENAAQALVRELREELSLVVAPIDALWQWQNDTLHLEWWSARVVGGTITPNPAEVRQVRWMTPDAIRTTPGVLENNIDFVDVAQRRGWLPSLA